MTGMTFTGSIRTDRRTGGEAHGRAEQSGGPSGAGRGDGRDIPVGDGPARHREGRAGRGPGDAGQVQEREGQPGKPGGGGRAVVGAAALGGDRPGQAKTGRGKAHERVALQHPHQQARRRHGQLPGPRGPAPGAERRGERPRPERSAAGDLGKQRARKGLLRRLVGEAQARHGGLRRVLGQEQGERPGGHQHPGHRPAQALLGAGGDEPTGQPEPLRGGAGGRGPAGPAVSPAQGEDGRLGHRREGIPV